MSPQEQRALYKDNRNLFQVLQSIINKLSAQKYDPATVQAYIKLAGYDIKIRSCDPLSGFNLLKEDIRTLIKNFKKYNYDKETDKKELSDLEEDIERKNFDVAAGLDKNRMFRYEEDVQRDIKEENDGEDIEDESEMYPEEETVQGTNDRQPPATGSHQPPATAHCRPLTTNPHPLLTFSFRHWNL